MPSPAMTVALLAGIATALLGAALGLLDGASGRREVILISDGLAEAPGAGLLAELRAAGVAVHVVETPRVGAVTAGGGLGQRGAVHHRVRLQRQAALRGDFEKGFALIQAGDALVVLGAARLGNTRLIDNLEI